MDETPWYYVAAGAQAGPVSADQIRSLFAGGVISRETLVWHQGLPTWQPLGQSPLTVSLPSLNAVGPGNWPSPGRYPPGSYVRQPAPGFGDAIRICLAKYVVWAGRATRPEFWWFYLFSLLVSIGASILDVVLADAKSGPISTLASLALFLPQLSVNVRRLHDTDRSAWWMLQPVGCILGAAILVGILISVDASGYAYLLAVIPALAVFWPIVFLCQAGTPGPNRYG